MITLQKLYDFFRLTPVTKSETIHDLADSFTGIESYWKN